MLNKIKSFFARFFLMPLQMFRLKRLSKQFKKMSRAEKRRYRKQLIKRGTANYASTGLPRKVRKEAAKRITDRLMIALGEELK